MKKAKLQVARKLRRVARVRSTISGTSDRPRLAVFRSLKHISAQIINDVTRKTLVAATDAELPKASRKKVETATEVGKLLAKKAKEQGVERVAFDRRDKKYHGRVKALADGAREGGLQF